jgi:beta-glucanase (GH16 family)
MKTFLYYPFLFLTLLSACSERTQESTSTSNSNPVTIDLRQLTLGEDHTLAFNVPIERLGRYTVRVFGSKCEGCEVWLEDYIGNPDERTYNITGTLSLAKGNASVDGAPLDAGSHAMKLHANQSMNLDSIVFEWMYSTATTPDTLVQEMDGAEWKLIWSDEFDGTGLPDSNKWSYNVGNWGWGNNEPQYYTLAREENVRQQDGNLIIEARKNDLGNAWTSARLTTQGKVAFTYGKIEFRAKVPEGRGTWAAGWLLGDSYRDELSWPYCGEIDVLECVGYEINDTTGSGLNHATCHTRAYYFKQGNQIGSEIALDSMNTKFHTYGIEWYPDRIEGYVDGQHYYTYDKNANELEWPFHAPHNIIINLAVGGGWGGARGIDQSYDRHRYVLDYIRVYGKQ